MLQESCAQPEATVFHLGGGPSSAEELKDIVIFAYFFFVCVFNQDPASRLYHHLVVPSLFVYLLPSLISNCLNLSFGTQGRSRRLNEPTN